MKFPAPLWLTALWILLCAYFNCVGWFLSAIHQLNPTGYAVALALGFALLLLGCRALGPIPVVRVRLGKICWRARQKLPAVFFLTALLVFLGGALYSPNNYDALTYRFPRVLHWFSQGQWHWIDAPDRRVNLSAAGFEWLMAPLFALTRSERGFFLINLVSYLLLPGLTFSTFVRLGISKRVAWHWMWLVSCGYCFVLQAGSIGNDSFAATFLLASLCFGLRAKQSGKFSDLCFSILAAALLTGAKASNLPLLLPCFLAALPSLPLFLRKPLRAGGLLAILAIATMASFLPIAAMNAYYTGDWTGDPANASQMKLDNPAYGVLGNAIQLAVNNVQPPIIPFASAWNEAAPKLLNRYLPQLAAHFPQIGLKWGELANEEGSGVGVGITGLALISILSIPFARRASPVFERSHRGFQCLVCWSGLVALAVLMAKFGNEGAGRLIAPYYAIILATLLLPASNRLLVGKRWWKRVALFAALLALPCVILTPARPLFPAQTVFTRLAVSHPQSRLISRASQVYSAYANRADILGPLRKDLPDDAKVIGFIGSDDSEVALWRPYGSRRVEILSKSTKPQAIPRIVLASDESMELIFGISVAQWVSSRNAAIIATEKLTTKVSRGPRDWYVIATDLSHSARASNDPVPAK